MSTNFGAATGPSDPPPEEGGGDAVVGGDRPDRGGRGRPAAAAVAAPAPAVAPAAAASIEATTPPPPPRTSSVPDPLPAARPDGWTPAAALSIPNPLLAPAATEVASQRPGNAGDDDGNSAGDEPAGNPTAAASDEAGGGRRFGADGVDAKQPQQRPQQQQPQPQPQPQVQKPPLPRQHPQNHPRKQPPHPLRQQPQHQTTQRQFQHKSSAPPSQQEDSQAVAPSGCEESSAEETERWARSLVGRWWEVFWDPDDSKEKKGEGSVPAGSSGNGGSVVDLTQSVSEGGSALSAGGGASSAAAPGPPASNAEAGDPTAPNAGFIKQNDRIVGFNGRRFDPPITGKVSFQHAIQVLKKARRPIVVMFERMTDARPPAAGPLVVGHGSGTGSPKRAAGAVVPPQATATRRNGAGNDDGPAAGCATGAVGPSPAGAVVPPQASAMRRNGVGNDDGDDVDDIPLNRLQRRQREEREESEGDDDIDWYDAKIFSYAGGKFAVHFLGDDPFKTYEMELTPAIVRPSARAWAKRTLALMRARVPDLLSIREGDAVSAGLPPSTDLPVDAGRLEDLGGADAKDGGKPSEICPGVAEYKKLLAVQQFLATRVSTHDDEEEEEEEDEEGGNGEDGPGPRASAVYVKHLCDCMKEAEKACEWLMSESTVLDAVRKIEKASSSPVENEGSKPMTKVSKQAVLSFLLDGSRFLNRLLALDPNRKTFGGNKRGRKKRRVGAGAANGGAFSDSALDSMLSKALVSNDSLEKTLSKLLNKAPPSSKNIQPASTLIGTIALLLETLWKPAVDWIGKAEDISSGRSGQFYSFGEVEAHLQSAKRSNLALMDLSSWTNEIVAKLRRARIYEMEAWAAIKACVQPVVSDPIADGNYGSDVNCGDEECISALQRLKDEATPGPPGGSGPDSSMRNLNPLGIHLIDSSGLTLPSPLTRAVLADAITVRQWILDLNQAKSARERGSFVQNIIERYVTLPQLPTPPNDGLGGVAANPSAVLAANTKDSITLLSSSCYSHNHIVCNAALRLQSSLSGSSTQDAFLRSKEGVSSVLAELTRLPTLSVVEEKLHIRQELIEWNEKAHNMMAASGNDKPSFRELEALHQNLRSILETKSDRRVKLCQQLKPNQLIEDQVKAFTVADEKVICPVTGAWVREQYRKSSEWLADYRSIVAILQSHGYPFSGAPCASASIKADPVDVERINKLLEERAPTVSFPEEFSQLGLVRRSAMEWTNSVHQTVLSDSLTLDERINQFKEASNLRPKGVLVDPSADVIHKWCGVFVWRLNLQQGIKTMTDHFNAWRNSHPPNSVMQGVDHDEMLRLIRSVLAPLIVEGQELLVARQDGSLPLFLASLKDKALRSMHTNGQEPVKRSEILESGETGNAVLNRILDTEVDQKLGSSLLVTRRVFWMMIYQCFFEALSSDFSGSLIDAKELLSLCPQGLATNSFFDTKAEESRLRKLIDDAENLMQKYSAALGQSTSLLQSSCFLHKEELRTCLLKLSDIQSSFNSKELELAVKLGNSDTKQLDGKIKGLTWLVGTFAYDILYPTQSIDTNCGPHPIHFNNLKELNDKIPLTIGPQWKVTGDCLDSEIVRICVLVRDLWMQTNEWKRNMLSIIPPPNNELSKRPSEGSGNVVTVDALREFTKNPILSKVIMPELDTAREVLAKACEVKEKVNHLFSEEYMTTDVNKAHLPDGNSLIADSGDFILYRFTGSEMYNALRDNLRSVREAAASLPIMTPEKATLEWMAKVFGWVGSISSAGQFNEEQLVIKIEHALGVLGQGHGIFYCVMDEVQLCLKGVNVDLQVYPEYLNVAPMKGCAHSLGLGLLSWAALLYECLKSDVDEEDKWKSRSYKAIDTFAAFELGNVDGQVSSFRDATAFRDSVNNLIDEANNLIVLDHELIHALAALRTKVNASEMFQQCLEIERVAMEENKFLVEKDKFTNPQTLVDDRYEILDCLLRRLSSDDIPGGNPEDSSLFMGEPSVRDKSRFLLEKSLTVGVETLGLDPNDSNIRDFCSIFAWNLEDAVYEKYHDNPVEHVSSEYRDKVRSLRFNLQDPKNPMLCAQVLAGNLKIEYLISASTEDLASNEMKLVRQKLEAEAIKSVVLAADSSKHETHSAAISSELAAKIRIDESSPIKSTGPEELKEACSPDDVELPSVASPASPQLDSPASLSSPIQNVSEVTSKILASIPPPPMHRSRMEPPAASKSASPEDDFPSPPPSPFLSPEESSPPIAKSRSHHITSQSGTDLFRITISKLKLSFTTKIAVDRYCKFKVDSVLPSILVEKGRLSIDEFNKFIHTKSGRWSIFHLKLSSIVGDSNASSYKKFYKEYETLGRIAMIQVSETTKLFLITPKFLRVCKCLNNVENLSRSSTYVVVVTKDHLTKI
ncbi:hypothetical protein ACHAWF_017477 [Thalassiosira exigua]